MPRLFLQPSYENIVVQKMCKLRNDFIRIMNYHEASGPCTPSKHDPALGGTCPGSRRRTLFRCSEPGISFAEDNPWSCTELRREDHGGAHASCRKTQI